MYLRHPHYEQHYHHDDYGHRKQVAQREPRTTVTTHALSSPSVMGTLPFGLVRPRLRYATEEAVTSYQFCALYLWTAHTPTAAAAPRKSSQRKNSTGKSKNNGGPSTIPPLIMPMPSISMHRSIRPITVLLPVAAITTNDTSEYRHGC
jgi:hypothetical protein